MKKTIAIVAMTLVIVSASMTTNVYAFSNSEERAIERMCEKAEAEDNLIKAIIKWIKAD